MRRGFTLVEMLVVISIIVLLTTMTIGAINFSRTGSAAMSGTASLVHSKLKGSLNRAIHAKLPVGVRLIRDNDEPTIVRSLAYVTANPPQESVQDREDVNKDSDRDELRRYVQVVDPEVADGLNWPANDPRRRAVIGVNTNWSDMASAGLIGPGSKIILDVGDNHCEFAIDPRSFPISRQRHDYVPGGYGGFLGSDITEPRASNGQNPFEERPANRQPPKYGWPTDDEILYLLFDPFSSAAACLNETRTQSGQPYDTEPLSFRITGGSGQFMGASVKAGEEIATLPLNLCIDLDESEVGESLDIMFAPRSAMVGRIDEVRLHIRPVKDALEDLPPQHGDRWIVVNHHSGDIQIEEE